MKKENIATLVFMVMIIAVLVVQLVDNQSQDAFFYDMRAHHHEAESVYSDVLSFMAKGGRNTRQQGEDLCQRIQRLEEMEGIAHDKRCEEIYLDDTQN